MLTEDDKEFLARMEVIYNENPPSFVQLGWTVGVHVCRLCGRPSFAWGKPPKPGDELPLKTQIQIDQYESFSPCGSCSSIRFKHPEVVEWVTQVVAFRDFLARKKP